MFAMTRGGHQGKGENTMTMKSLICAAAVLSGLGCATPQALAVACNGGSCNVDVHIENCVITAPDIDNTGANNIFWNIDNASKQAGYTFAAGIAGVTLKDPPPSGCTAAGAVFDSPDRLNNWKFKLHNKGNLGTYCYGVQIVDVTTTPPRACPPLDPSIVNH